MSKFILLTEDDSDDRLLFEEALREVCQESTLELAYDGLTTIDILGKMKEGLPDVIVLDLNMPGVCGLGCLNAIRDDVRFRHIPVLVLTTSSDEETIDESYKRGATFFATKPNRFEKLQKIVDRIVDFQWQEVQGQPDRKEFVQVFQV